MRLNAETEVAQDLRPQPVAQSHILESDHALLRKIPFLTRGTALAGQAAERDADTASGSICGQDLRFYSIIAASPAQRTAKAALSPDPQKAGMVSSPLTGGC
jgi:hypothetical protein